MDRSPHGLALAVLGAVLRKDLGGGYHGGAGRFGDRGRVVGGAVVHDDQLVDHGVAQHELSVDGLHRGADGGALVAGGQADRDSPAALGGDQTGRREVAIVEGAQHDGGHPATRDDVAPATSESMCRPVLERITWAATSSRAAEGRAL